MLEQTNQIATGLLVFGPFSVEPKNIDINEGDSIFGGTAASCGFALVGEDVGQFQCMFSLNDGKLVLQNCGTGGSIRLNDVQVESDTECNNGDEFEIGRCRVVVRQHFSESENGIHPVPTEKVTEDVSASVSCSPLVSQHEEISNSVEEVEEVCFDSTSSLLGVDECDTMNDVSYESFVVEDESSEPNNDLRLQDVELDLLRSEVEFLQAELATKDQQLEDSLKVDGRDVNDHENVNESEVGRLVNRLEDLLVELQSSDERVKTLEDLLRVSDEATQAEQEERAQLESWLNEVENRVSQQEVDRDEEIKKLKSHCGLAQQRQRKAEEQLQQILSKSVNAEPKLETLDNSMLNDLQQKIAQQERLIQIAEEENAELKSTVSALQAEDNRGEMHELEEKLIQMELETSRERAEIARQRADVENLRNQIENADRQAPESNESDCRIAAMRQHLRELHEEEKIVREQQKANSLSGRITRLLGRA